MNNINIVAKKLDPAFSTIWFSEKWNHISKKNPEKFDRSAQMLYLAWCHVNIWVNQIQQENCLNLKAQDMKNFAQEVDVLLREQEWETLGLPESIIAIAQYQAERERYNLDVPDLFTMLSVRGIKIDAKIKKLTDFYKSLPCFEFQVDKDLQKLETSVREVANILEFPINPRLVFEKGAWVWDL